MAQKDRNNITQAVNQNVYDNTNKEILASMLRDVFNDYRDSFFNLIDDHLKNMLYEEGQTLEQVINASANVPPLWGSTDWFDVGTPDGDIENYSPKGIVSSMSYERTGNHDSQITINFSKSILNRKLAVNVFFNGSNYNDNNDVCVPVIRVVSSTQIKVALREVSSNNQKIRLEILAFTVSTS